MSKIRCCVNGERIAADVNPGQTLRSLLVSLGHFAVRDSDDGDGFAGSDTVIVDDLPAYANLMLAESADGCDIRTPDSLGTSTRLSDVQEAMIRAGVVQSAYNAPAAALLLTWLLEHHPEPTREQVKDVLSGIFIRDTGYELYYTAVDLVVHYRKTGEWKNPFPQFVKGTAYIGKPRGKIDGPQLVSGERAYVEDRIPAGEKPWSLYLLGSPYANAIVESVDSSEAEKVDGVAAVITAANCPDIYYMQAGQGNPEPSPHDRRLFNWHVRFVGDRVAAVVARDRETAKRAAKLVKVKYKVLKPIFTVEEAMAPGAPLVHNGIVRYRSGAPADLDEYNKSADPRDGDVIYQFPLHGDIRHNIAAQAHGFIGDVDKAFREADYVVENTYQTSQVQCTPLEPHTCYCRMENGRLIIRDSTQVPFHVRRIVSWVTGLPESRIHVIKERVGGGYGSKQDILIEDLVGYACYITGKPIYYRHSRHDEFTNCSTRHPMRVTVKIGAKKDGKITAIWMDNRANTGPYGNHALTVPMNACSKTLPLMAVPNMKFDVTTYYTNIPPAGAYQGYGTPKGSYGLMMCLAELAEKMHVDYADLVEKNMVHQGYMLDILAGLGEGRAGNVVPVGVCGLKEAMETGKKMIGWGKKEASPDPDWKIGKGFAIIQQGSGLPGLDQANAWCKLMTDGSFALLSGGADLGTGLDTVSAKIMCETFGVSLDRVTVTSGDSDSCTFDKGAYASSGTFFSGNATLLAANDLKAAMLKEAAYQMHENADDLILRAPGEVFSTKTEATLSYAKLSHDATSGTGHGQLVGHGGFATMGSAVPYGAHFAQVAVNVKTGEVKVQKFYAVQDCGIPINPELAMGQVYGAVMKSIGHSLYEEMVLDPKGVCRNASLTDYHVPMITEAPDDFKVVLLDIKDDASPLGAKSVSEISCNGAAPAIGTAIHDACGVWVRSWPFTPEKILRGLGKIV